MPGFVNYTLPVPGFHPEVRSDPPAVPSCSISPPSGTVLQTFDITCEAKSFCEAGCLYCFKTSTGDYPLNSHLFKGHINDRSDLTWQSSQTFVAEK